MGCEDKDLCRERKFASEASKNIDEFGDDEQEHTCDHDNRHDENDAWVEHRGEDLGAKFCFLLVGCCDFFHRVREATRDFTCCDHADHEGRENIRVTRTRDRERCAAFHVLAHDRVFERLHRSNQGEASVNHGGELTTEQGKMLRFYFLTTADAFLHAGALAVFTFTANTQRCQAHCLEAARGGGLRVGGDGSGDHFPVVVSCRVGIPD